MKLHKLTLLSLFLLLRFCASADIALPKQVSLPDTKYYFANVDSFSQYKFYVKNLNTNKTFKIKQSQAFVLKPDTRSENHLDVWAVNKSTGQQTNVFSLKTAVNEKPQEFNTVYIAITFYFDKSGKLSYKQTIMKPDCYSKKQQVPFSTSFNNTPTVNLNSLVLIPVCSLLVLFSLSVIGKMKQRSLYV